MKSAGFYIVLLVVTLLVSAAARAEIVHRFVEFDRPLSNRNREALEQLGVELHLKGRAFGYLASVPDDALANLEALGFVERVAVVAPEQKLSDTLDAIQRILDPKDPLECDGGPEASDDPVFSDPCPTPEDSLTILIGFYPDVPFQTAKGALDQLGISSNQDDFLFAGVIVAEATHENLAPLAAIDEVHSVEELGEDGNHNAVAARTSKVDQIRSPAQPYDLAGQGVRLGLWEATTNFRVRTSHDDFDGRVIQQESSGNLSAHATHVAGTIIGDGDSDGDRRWTRGMAPEATIWAYNSANDWDEMANAAGAIRVSNHSYGELLGWTPTNRQCDGSLPTWQGDYSSYGEEDHRFGKYRKMSQLFDQVVDDTDLIVVKSAGNDRDDTGPHGGDQCDSENQPEIHYHRTVDDCDYGWCPNYHDDDGAPDGYDTLGPRGVAKNVITVGAVADDNASMLDFSSWGPADDGRIKPDLVANGDHVRSTGIASNTAQAFDSGTSMAAPVVAGIVALLLEHYANENGNAVPLAATIKAVLLHTAEESGGTLGPDYRYGWGLADAKAAADFITADADPGVFEREIIEQTYSGGVDIYPRLANQGHDFKVTLVWTDPPHASIGGGTDNRTPAIVNDLDLSVVGPDGRLFFPWTLDPNNPSDSAERNRRNAVDNVEQVLIRSNELDPRLLSSPYVIEVSLTGTLTNASQPYTLLIETVNPGLIVAVNPIPGGAPFSDDLVLNRIKEDGTFDIIIGPIKALPPQGEPLQPGNYTVTLGDGPSTLTTK